MLVVCGKPPAIIGIDNGLSGGMCALCPESGILIDKAPIPTRDYLGKEEADPLAVARWVSGFDCQKVGVEDLSKHFNSMQAMRSQALSFGLIVGALERAGMSPCRVSVREWQSTVIGKIPAGKTKEFALRRALELWPDADWRESSRHKNPHDGMIDAALIAAFLHGGFKNN